MQELFLIDEGAAGRTEVLPMGFRRSPFDDPSEPTPAFPSVSLTTPVTDASSLILQVKNLHQQECRVFIRVTGINIYLAGTKLLSLSFARGCQTSSEKGQIRNKFCGASGLWGSSSLLL